MKNGGRGPAARGAYDAFARAYDAFTADYEYDRWVAEVTADYEVLVQGEPRGPVVLPVTGMPRKAEGERRERGRRRRERERRDLLRSSRAAPL